MPKNQLNSNQIRPGAILTDHIGGQIEESKLNIDKAALAVDVFGRKLVIDFVQVNGKAIAAASASATFTTEITVPEATTDTEKGAVVQDSKNKVIIRNSATGEPVISTAGTEVYGRLTKPSTDFVVTFFALDELGVETAYTFTDPVTIDAQYPQRFDLNTVAETFAANEKFVDGAADVSSRLDLKQIAADAFGSGYALTQDGIAARAKSLAAELVEETSGAVNTGVKAKTVIDEIVEARGASADIGARMTAAELETSGVKSEVVNARGTYGTVKERLDAVDTTTHSHYADDKQVLAGDAIIGTSRYDLPEGVTFVAADKSLQVFYNGSLQMVGVHYTEVTNVGGEGVGVDFNPDMIAAGDVIQLRWHK